ncbi:hypothetical protein Alches_02030 [Alicyclobacillus hesperidum subsp. aegles]|uniref:hypothetical protein n=1 Tax=Alicyclobacillus hesperidum TaxID=89784 RepID=UPI00222D7457|nr:hypothetical protein [Alicyclobacillus hesperidum]GLG00164.1 hypothetical protein Alches_02030 [Alicyclobacillus hesperidum subsp. aegles]
MQWGMWLASALIGAGSNAETAFGWPRRSWVDMVFAVSSAGCLWLGGISALHAGLSLPSALAHAIGICTLSVVGGWLFGHRLVVSATDMRAVANTAFAGRMAAWLAQCLASLCMGLGAGLSHLPIGVAAIVAALAGICTLLRPRLPLSRNRSQQQPHSQNDERDDTL